MFTTLCEREKLCFSEERNASVLTWKRSVSLVHNVAQSPKNELTQKVMERQRT